MSNVQDNIAADYANKFNRPLSVSVIKKIDKWPYLQEMTYNGTLGHQKNDFFGVQDWREQITAYSLAHFTLAKPLATIIAMTLKNKSILAKTISLSGLGNVGNMFSNLYGFARTFSVTSEDLSDPSKLNSKIKSVTI
jgi:hypothetical protein